MKKRTGFLMSLMFMALSAYAASSTEVEVRTTPSRGAVEFIATGKPSMIKIKGQGDGAAANLKISDGKLSGDFKFNMESLKTGIDLRDAHMKKKYLQTQEFPQAALQLKDLALPGAWSRKNAIVNEQSFKGMLKLHGVEKEIEGTFSIASNSLDKLDGVASFEVKLSDFKIDIPEYLGVKVADTVKVKVSLNEMALSEKIDAAAPPVASKKKIE